MGVNCQFHDPAALTPGKRATDSHWIWGWVGPKTDEDIVEMKESLGPAGIRSTISRLSCPTPSVLHHLACQQLPRYLYTNPKIVASVKLGFLFSNPWLLILYNSRSDRRWMQNNLKVSSFCVCSRMAWVIAGCFNACWYTPCEHPSI